MLTHLVNLLMWRNRHQAMLLSHTNRIVEIKAWEWRNWKRFLSSNFKAVHNIQKYHHFRFLRENPGYVFLKESVDSVETKVSILKNTIMDLQARPRVITRWDYQEIASGEGRQFINCIHVVCYWLNISRMYTFPKDIYFNCFVWPLTILTSITLHWQCAAGYGHIVQLHQKSNLELG